MLSVAMLASCKVNQLTVEVSNPSDVSRENETVEVAWNDVLAKLPAASQSNVTDVCAKTGKEVVHQVIFHGQPSPQTLIFQVSLAPKETVKMFVREGAPKQEHASLTFGRFVPERMDDFAWENDRAAYRMYGPALAPNNPSNGVDLWLKKTNNLIVDKFYYQHLNHKISYHEDHGEGLDCYTVGAALGAGGIAPFVNDTLWPGKHFVTHRVLDNGPLRTTFVLAYNNHPVGSEIYSKEIVISLDAGSQLNKGIVSFDGNFTDIKLAAGILMHADPGKIKTDVAAGFNAFGEIATSDAGVPAGRMYVATVIPDGKMTESLQQQQHILALAPYKRGEKFTYYFGGGWSQWGFPNDEAWFDYVAAFAANLKNPLKVELK